MIDLIQDFSLLFVYVSIASTVAMFAYGWWKMRADDKTGSGLEETVVIPFCSLLVGDEPGDVTLGLLSAACNRQVKWARCLHCRVFTWTTRDSLLSRSRGELTVTLPNGAVTTDSPVGFELVSHHYEMVMRYKKVSPETDPFVISTLWEVTFE